MSVQRTVAFIAHIPGLIKLVEARRDSNSNGFISDYSRLLRYLLP